MNQENPSKLASRWSRKGGFCLALAMILAVALASIAYINLTLKPMDRLSIGPQAPPGAMTFTWETGGPAELADGVFSGGAAGELLLCTFSLPEQMDTHALLYLESYDCDAAVYVDGVLVADLGRAFGGTEEEKTDSSGFLSLKDAAGKELTLAVRFHGEPTLDALPQMVLYNQVLAYDSQALSAAASAALPAGAFLAACGVGAVWSLAHGGGFGGMLRAAGRSLIQFGSFYSLQVLVNYLVLLACFLLAVYDFLQVLSQREGRLQTLALQKRYAEENAASLCHSLEETRAMRHEQRHHMEALYALCQEGSWDRVRAYVERLRGEMDAAPAPYTDNSLVNAIVTGRVLRARELGARVSVSIQVPAQVGVEDADLAILLSNALDNALEAIGQVAVRERRMLRLKMGIYQGRLFLLCENSYDAPLAYREDGSIASGKAGAGHGYGLALMERVAKKYNSILSVQHQEGIFSVKTNLLLKVLREEEELSRTGRP